MISPTDNHGVRAMQSTLLSKRWRWRRRRRWRPAGCLAAGAAWSHCPVGGGVSASCIGMVGGRAMGGITGAMGGSTGKPRAPLSSFCTSLLTILSEN
jgi:hypothetical protein